MLPVVYQPRHAAPVWKCFSPPCNPRELSFNSLLVLIVPPPGSLLGPFPLTRATLVPPWNFEPNTILVHFTPYLQCFDLHVYLPGHSGSSLDVEIVSNSSLPPQQSGAGPGHIRYSSTTEVNYDPNCSLPKFYHDSVTASSPTSLHPPSRFYFPISADSYPYFIHEESEAQSMQIIPRITLLVRV